MAARVASTSAAATPLHGLDAVGAVEHEGEVLLRLLVPAHELDAAPRLGARRQVGRQVEAADDPAVLRDPVVVDAAQPPGQQRGEEQADGHRLAVAQVPVVVLGRPAPSSAWASVWP